MKKIYLLTLILACFASMSMPVSATVVTGQLPDGKWQYDTGSKELYIDAAVMPDYDFVTKGNNESYFPKEEDNPFGYSQINVVRDAPWANYASSIRSVRFSHRIVSIGTHAFSGCYRLKKVSFNERSKEASLIRVGSSAFCDCWALDDFDFSSIGVIINLAFKHTGFKSVELPAVTYLDQLCFEDCENLRRQNTLRDYYDLLNVEPSIRVTSPNIQTVKGHLCNYNDGRIDKTIVPVLFLFGFENLFPETLYYYEEQYLPGGILSNKGSKPAYWYVRDSKYLIVSGNEDFTGGSFSSDADIPWRLVQYLKWVDKIYLYNLKTVAARAFREFSYVTDVKLNSGLFEIKEQAFEGCTALQNINLEKVSNIRMEAFNGCVNLEVADMYNIVNIGIGAFCGCYSLRKITFGENFSSIANTAFKGASTVTGAKIYVNSAPPSKEKTGSFIFSNFNIQSSKLYVPNEYASLYRTTDPWKEFQQEVQIVFPYKGDGWQLIEAKYDDGSRKGVALSISDVNVLSKNYLAPAQTPWYDVRDVITYVNIEKSAGTVIGNNAFNGLKNLKGIAMTNGCTRIGKYAFKDCTSFYDPWFSDANNDYLNGDIELSAFENCTSLTGINFGTKLNSIGANAFHNTGLKKIFCNAQDPPVIQENTFDYPELIELHVPQSVLVRYINADYWHKFIFADVNSEHGNIINAGKFYNGFYVLHTDGYLYCVATESTGTVDLFGEDRYYFEGDVKEIMVSGDLKYLGPVFTNLPNVHTVTISSFVEKMEGTFSGCPQLLTVNLMPVNKLELGDETFSNCYNLYTISMNGVTSVGKKCFYKCNNLRELKAPYLLSVDSAAFASCANLESIDLGQAEMQGMRVLEGCTSLKTFIFNGPNIARYTFEDCKAIKSVYFGSKVNSIFGFDVSLCTLTDIHYTRPFPGDVSKENFNASNLPNIKLYVPKVALDKFKTYETWKEMDIQEDRSSEAANLTLPASGVFNDDHSSWMLDENGKLSVRVTGTQAEWPDGFSSYSDHPLEPWKPYITSVEVSGENARLMASMLFNDNGTVNHDGGVKTIVFGEGVKYIGAYFGYSLYYLTDVYCYTEHVPEVHNKAFDFTVRIKNNKPKLHVLSNLVADYEAHEYWHYFDVVGDLDAPCYAVTLDAQFGAIRVQESDINLNAVPKNTVLHLVAIPDEGYEFVKWENYDPENGLTVTKNITVTAVFAGSSMPEGMEQGYVCDFTKKANGHSAYNDAWTYDNDWSVFGGANNNGAWTHARMGGKNLTLANANPVHVTNINAFDKEITGVRVHYPEGSFKVNNMKLNEWGVKVYEDVECTQLLYTVKGSQISSDESKLIVLAEEGKPWSAGCGIQVYWDLSNESSTNGIVYVSKIEYLVSKDVPAAETFTVRFLNWDGTELQSSEVEQGDMPAYKGDKPTRPDEGNVRYVFAGWDPDLDVVTADIDYTAQFVVAEGLGSIQHSDVSGQKVLRDGVLLIERGGKTYNALGTEVR